MTGVQTCALPIFFGFPSHDITTLISHYFDHIISSHQFGKPKENLQFWHDLQNYSHFVPEQTLFIDDSESVLKTAANFGIKHILSIKHPDSQTVQHRQSQFPMLEHFKDLGLDIVQLKHNIQERIAIRADALAFLQALAASDKQVWLVTNAHPQLLEQEKWREQM